MSANRWDQHGTARGRRWNGEWSEWPDPESSQPWIASRAQDESKVDTVKQETVAADTEVINVLTKVIGDPMADTVVRLGKDAWPERDGDDTVAIPYGQLPDEVRTWLKVQGIE